ncbi:MAG: hypothetical protein WCS77_00245 [Elusimicrobiaceae bacterium]
MDILHKLRLLFWTLVTLLWGITMFQFYSNDLPFKDNNFFGPLIKRFTPKKEKKVIIIKPKPEEETPPAPAPDVATVAPRTGIGQPITTVPRVLVPEETGVPDVSTRKERVLRGQAEPNKHFQAPAPPPGFSVRETEHFLLYIQSGIAQSAGELEQASEGLHKRLMNSLSVYTADENQKVLIYLYADSASYTAATGRPEWSAATSSKSKRSIYTVQGPDTMNLLAHELTHIYFDSFFDAGSPSPLWLSEGMAILAQTEETGFAPAWIEDGDAQIRRGKFFPLAEITEYDNFDGMDSAQIKLWYAQSFSLVRFLRDEINRTDNFYAFCKNLKNGVPVAQSLYRAYGLPFNSLKHLEYAWKESVARAAPSAKKAQTEDRTQTENQL